MGAVCELDHGPGEEEWKRAGRGMEAAAECWRPCHSVWQRSPQMNGVKSAPFDAPIFHSSLTAAPRQSGPQY